MECFLLGSGGMMPMPRRRLTSVLVRTDQQDYLFDAGEGVQVSFKELGLGIKRLSVVAVSHLHADHVLGLPGLLMLRSQVDDPPPLTIVGPKGIKRFVEHVRTDLRTHITFPVEYVELDPSAAGGTALEGVAENLHWAPLNHSVPCIGFRLEEHPRPGRFHPDRAERLGLPKGPQWRLLQQGQTVTTPDGRPVRPDQVLGPTRRGRATAYVTDTRPCNGAVRLLHRVDLGFVEGMFLDEDESLAKDKKHMTVVEASAMAARARASRIVLVHISPRYQDQVRRRLRQEARTEFPSAVLGRDLDTFEVSVSDDPLHNENSAQIDGIDGATM